MDCMNESNNTMIVDKTHPNCQMCMAPITGLAWTQKISLGVESIESAMRKFNMGYQQVADHLDTHIAIKQDDTDEGQGIYLGRLLKSITLIDEKIYLINVSDNDEIDIAKALVPLFKERRENLKILTELQSKLAETTALMKATDIEANVFGVIELISRELCSECSAKMADCVKGL